MAARRPPPAGFALCIDPRGLWACGAEGLAVQEQQPLLSAGAHCKGTKGAGPGEVVFTEQRLCPRNAASHLREATPCLQNLQLSEGCL